MTFAGIVTDVRDEDENAPPSMCVTLSVIVMNSIEEYRKATLLMVVAVSRRSTSDFPAGHEMRSLPLLEYRTPS